MNSTLAVIDTEVFFQRLEEIIEAKLQKFPEQQVEGDALPELLTRRQTADFLSVSLGTLDNLARAGIVQKHYLGSSPRFKREEVRKAFESWKKYQHV